MWATYTQNCAFGTAYLTIHSASHLRKDVVPVYMEEYGKSYQPDLMMRCTNHYLCILIGFSWLIIGKARSELGYCLETVWKAEPQEPHFLQCVCSLCGFRLCASVIKDILMYNVSDLCMTLFLNACIVITIVPRDSILHLGLHCSWPWTAGKKVLPLMLASVMQGWLTCDLGGFSDFHPGTLSTLWFQWLFLCCFVRKYYVVPHYFCWNPL